MRIGRVSVPGIINSISAAQPRASDGTIDITLQFDHGTVTGQFTGPRPLGSGTLSGTISGGTCHLIFQNSVWDGPCGPQGFTGSGNSHNNQSTMTLTWRTTPVEVIDYDARDRAANEARLAAEAARQREEARIAALPNAGPAATRRFEALVQADSRGWAFNRFDSGSLHNVKVLTGTANSANYVLRGEYTYNGGSPGWVIAQMNGPNLVCIQFWDAVVGCRALRTQAQGEAMRAMAISALTGGGAGGSGGNSGGSGGNSDDMAMQQSIDEQNRQYQQSEPPPPPPPPVEPIGGNSGLYGSDHSCC